MVLLCFCSIGLGSWVKGLPSVMDQEVLVSKGVVRAM
jgi:hypothetical protein